MLPTSCDRATDGLALPSSFDGSRAALVVAHPGHELRVYGWLCLARPIIFVLTDGSGHTGLSRLPATTNLIQQIGAKPGCVFGRFTDVDVYNAVLDQQTHLFISLAEELASAFLDHNVKYVVGDAIEGYNPIHDVCRGVINLGVRLARRTADYEIDNLDFLLVGNPVGQRQCDRGKGIYLKLNEDRHIQKMRAAAAYSELSRDVDHALGSFGAEAFQVESLRPLSDSELVASMLDEPPFYEQHGEKQVAAGYYKRVVRYREHMAPLFAALDRYGEQGV